MEPEVGVTWPHAQEARIADSPQKLRVRRDPPLGPPEGAQPCQRLMSDFWPPDP